MGRYDFVLIYCRVNNVTNKDAFPLSRIDDSLDALSGSQWFSTLDLRSGYWQAEMANVDKVNTASSMGTGLYEFNVMPFGLCNAPGTFQRLMEKVLRGLLGRTRLIYIADIIIYARTLEEHMSRLNEVMTRLREAGLRLKPSKCELIRREVNYLGFVKFS
ncbi:Retrovirus-related Pol polyprotein from transposon [Apostichopus japonicus]|uniref:Retrovirus-related Pol polyprotein from transposon n=1 Tax=Stichopus japonicus TaxID=307972 RepID=A0A2G8JEC8_STIJA|nr:Retrovirus-related Pol polyprotein from transposon [Apostichopus japonicus]